MMLGRFGLAEEAGAVDTKQIANETMKRNMAGEYEFAE